jgi:hypothetical protein
MKTRIAPLVSDCITALKQEDFRAYIQGMDQLGEALYHAYQQQHPDAKPHLRKADRKALRAWLQKTMEKEGCPQYPLTPEQALAYCAFEEVWLDEYLKKPVSMTGHLVSKRHLSPKTHLKKSTRHHIRLGMLCIANSTTPPQTIATIHKEHIAHLDQAAHEAILYYYQKIHHRLIVAGRILSFAVSLASALTISVAVGLFFASPLGLGMAVGIVTASLAFVIAFAVYWGSTHQFIPDLLIDMFGKDRLLEGWTHYRDDETGEKKELSWVGKGLLGCSMLLSTLLSVGIGIMTFSLTAYFAQWPLFTFLMVGTATCGFPPLGIALAVVAALGSFTYFMDPLAKLLHVKNIKRAIKGLFRDVLWAFDVQNKSPMRLKLEKALAFTLVGLFSALTLLCVIILQINYAQSLALWMQTVGAVSSTVAIGIADGLAMIGVLIGKLPYAVRTITDCVLYLFPNKNKKTKDKKTTSSTSAKQEDAASKEDAMQPETSEQSALLSPTPIPTSSSPNPYFEDCARHARRQYLTALATLPEAGLPFVPATASAAPPPASPISSSPDAPLLSPLPSPPLTRYGRLFVLPAITAPQQAPSPSTPGGPTSGGFEPQPAAAARL